MRWTEEKYQEFLANRIDTKTGTDMCQEADPGPEKELQKTIMDWCRQRGYPVFHDYSRKKNIAGWPDLTIVMEGGRVLWIELKAARGKLSKEQKHLRQVFFYLRHDIHQVKSFKRFLEVAEK